MNWLTKYRRTWSRGEIQMQQLSDIKISSVRPQRVGNEVSERPDKVGVRFVR